MKVVDVAMICHEANRELCLVFDDFSQKEWVMAPKWQQASAIDGVRFHLANPDASPSDSHQNWLKRKRDEGWRYGPQKDASKKLHPCCVPFEELPIEQQVKDVLFKSIVEALRPLVTSDEN